MDSEVTSTWKTAAIIGSFRKHLDQVMDVARCFSRVGIEVLAPVDSIVVDPNVDFIRFECDSEDLEDHQIQAHAMDRILQADFIYVVAPGGYIGRTTCYELGRIHERGRPVFYSERPLDVPIHIVNEAIVSCEDLTKGFRRFRMSAPFVNQAMEMDGLSE